MSDRNQRTELAASARGLRRYLETAPHGELLAAARPGASPPRTSPTVETPATPRGAPDLSSSWEPVARRPPASPPATPGAAAPVRSAHGSEVDLFGQTMAPPRETPALDTPRVMPVEVAVDPTLLNASGASREPILTRSVPLLDAIATEVRACRQCGLCETRTQAVPGVGSATSGIVFVGEAPGADEDRRGEPFVGRAGELLTRIIQAMDEARLIPDMKLDRSTVYICNVLKCRPPENRNPLPHEIQKCSPYLERQLEALRPRIICCLGKFAAELLVGVKGTIGGLRGRIYRYRGAKLIVTYHPAACLRNPAYKRPVWEDMQLLAREYLTD